MFSRTLTALAVSLATLSQPVFADEETDLLRQQIKSLEARLDALEHKQAVEKAAVPVPKTAAQATPQQKTTASADAGISSNTTANVEYGSHGLNITSPDKNFQFHVGGYVQADDHAFIGNTPSSNTDQFFIRSARPIFEAKFYDNFSARLMLDFGNGQTTLLDAYGDYNATNAFNVRVGKFKDPIGIERWQSEQNVLFVERGMTTNLVPYRDNGVQLYGELIQHALEYELALTNGAPDLVNATNNTDNDQTVTARVFTHPFYYTDIHALKGFGIGAAGSYGNRNASLANPNLTTGYVTPAQTKFFTYATTAFANGEQWRINPQAIYYNGPFSMIGEYVLENQEIKAGNRQAILQNDAWEAIATYVLTGEDARFDGVVPHRNFDPRNNQWGAFELVARISQLRVDDAAFPVFASLSTSAKEAQETTVGGTWYMNTNVKVNFDLAVTRFDGGAANNGSRPTEKAVLSRVQFKF